MTTRLPNLWQQRSPQERKSLALVATVFLLGLYAWLVWSFTQSGNVLRNSVPVLRMQAQVFELQAAELEHLRTLPVLASTNSDLLLQVEQTVLQAGLSGLLPRLEAQGRDHVLVGSDAIPTSTLLDWISVLQQQGILVDKVLIESLSTPGLVSVTLVLTRTAAK
jgi:general secretion pathway protein M